MKNQKIYLATSVVDYLQNGRKICSFLVALERLVEGSEEEFTIDKRLAEYFKEWYQNTIGSLDGSSEGVFEIGPIRTKDRVEPPYLFGSNYSEGGDSHLLDYRTECFAKHHNLPLVGGYESLRFLTMLEQRVHMSQEKLKEIYLKKLDKPPRN